MKTRGRRKEGMQSAWPGTLTTHDVENIEMVKRYAHHYPESLRPGIEKLDLATGQKITNFSQFPEKRAKERG